MATAGGFPKIPMQNGSKEHAPNHQLNSPAERGAAVVAGISPSFPLIFQTFFTSNVAVVVNIRARISHV